MAAIWLRAISRAFGCESSRTDLVSPLPREECVRRLQEVANSSWMIFGSRPLIGRVGETSFSLRRRISGWNSFQTYLYGIFEQEARQTRLRCRFGVHPAVVGFMIFWFGALSFFGGADVVNAIVHSSSSSAPSLITLAGPFLMLAFGVAVVIIGRFSARHEQAYMLKILATALNAHEESWLDARAVGH
jgi:hypothetical protein